MMVNKKDNKEKYTPSYLVEFFEKDFGDNLNLLEKTLSHCKNKDQREEILDKMILKSLANEEIRPSFEVLLQEYIHLLTSGWMYYSKDFLIEKALNTFKLAEVESHIALELSYDLPYRSFLNYMLGLFHYHGIAGKINKEKALQYYFRETLMQENISKCSGVTNPFYIESVYNAACILSENRKSKELSVLYLHIAAGLKHKEAINYIMAHHNGTSYDKQNRNCLKFNLDNVC